MEQSGKTVLSGDGADEVRRVTAERDALRAELQQARAREKKLDDMLVQAEKMDSLGKLVSGVAHDINNLLQVICGHTELLLLDAQPGTPAFDELTEIQKAAGRSTEFARQLLSFSRKQVVNPKPQSLNTVVEDLSKILKRILGDTIILKYNFSSELPVVKVDTLQMTQILTNLMVNARDAMNGAGTLTLETFRMRVEASPAHAAGDYAVLAVGDSGSGMTPEVQAHIFDMFFTTKPVGRGTGLGLSTVAKIVKDLKGFIEVDSHLGQGTTFRIYIPVCGEKELADHAAKASRPLVRGNGETILIVDDRESVLAFITRLLSQEGYRTLSATDPEVALRVGTAAGSLDLLFSDVMMPGMNGWELYRKLQATRPSLKALFISGYMPKSVERMLNASAHFLKKPCTVSEILTEVSAMLKK